MTTGLSGRIALVTGASRGIGAGIAKGLAEEGAYVVGTATTEAGAGRITKTLQDAGLQGQGYVLDITSSDAVQRLFDDLGQGQGQPSILVNNAGITRDNIMLRMTSEQWDEVINTNLTAACRLTQVFLRPMVKARWGRIINITSVVGCTGHAGQANYAAAKAGMIAFTKSLAQEVASRGITVNAIAPGFIDTDMTRALTEQQREQILSTVPARSVGKPEFIAYAVAFLASERASYITGDTIHVNGGMYMP